MKKYDENHFFQFLDCLSVFSEHAPRDLKIFYAFKIYDYDGDDASINHRFNQEHFFNKIIKTSLFSLSVKLIFDRFSKTSLKMN